MSYFCPVCTNKWKNGQKSIQCTSCLGWVHHNNRNNCSGLTNTEFEIHCNDINKQWVCDKCNVKSLSLFPFTTLDDTSWLDFNEIKTNQHTLSDEINMLNSAEAKDFVAQCDSIQNLINLENNDDDDILPTQVNSKYYDIKQLNNLICLPVLDYFM